MDELVPGQEELLETLVEASRHLARHEQELTWLPGDDSTPGGIVVGAQGLREHALRGDIWALNNMGFVSAQLNTMEDVSMDFVLLKKAYDWYESRQLSGSSTARVEGEVQAYLDRDAFGLRYPKALKRWEEAEELLHLTSPDEELTTIGLKLREALQRFATELLELHGTQGAPTEPEKTVARIAAVLEQRRAQLSDAHYSLLVALIDYWHEASDLVQRQVHGDQKDGEPVTWDDAQAGVLHTAITMFEIDRWLGPLAD